MVRSYHQLSWGNKSPKVNNDGPLQGSERLPVDSGFRACWARIGPGRDAVAERKRSRAVDSSDDLISGG